VLNRQKLVIQVLRTMGGSAGRLQLTKLLFLLGQEGQSRGGSAFYSFLPYRYGPYSFTLVHEIEGLVNNGYVEERRETWTLTTLGLRTPLKLNDNISWDANAIVRYYGALRHEDLIESVYGRYPWYTAMAEDVSRRNAAPPAAQVAIHTMGYEGLHVDEFLDLLLRTGIARVIDVRRNPLSRKYGYHSRTLERLAGLVGIDYLHLPELGIASERRKQLEGGDDYDELFYWYRGQLEHSLSAPVRRAVDSVTEAPSVLICQEADPRFCHRAVLAECLSAITGLEVLHLGRWRCQAEPEY
jgi:hypothetical protein